MYDLDSVVLNNVRHYAALTIKNTGADARGWWWYLGVSASQLEQLLSQNQARPIDIERVGTGIYDVVMHARGSTAAWHFYSKTAAQVTDMMSQYRARIVDLEAYDTQFGSVYDVAMVNAGSPLEAHVGNLMRNGTDGWVGSYLKVANGATLAGINATRVFEPASLLKTLHHVHAMRQVQQAQISLEQSFTFYAGGSESCPGNTNQVTESLQQVLAGMMMASSNSRTRVITDRFGMPAINATADALGMTNTELLHHIGCAGTPNRLTLVDIGKLHEAVINGYLGDQRQMFYSLMVTAFYGNGYAEGALKPVIDAEALTVGLSTAQRDAFVASTIVVGKRGGYGTPTGFHRTWGAYVRLPFRADSGPFTREYVTGAFVSEATVEANAIAAASQGAAEVLRDEIRAAMVTWKNHVAGQTTTYGMGCRTSRVSILGHAVARLAAEPNIGTEVDLELNGAPFSAPGVLFVGGSMTTWQGIPLPVDLGFLGMAPCRLLAAPDVTTPVFTTAAGLASVRLAIPFDRALVGQSTFSQYAALDAAANAGGLVTSNGAQILIGGQVR